MQARLCQPLWALALITNALLASAAHAQTQASESGGFYAGGNIGSSHFRDAPNGASTGGKLYGGYQFNPQFALETNLFSLGQFSTTRGRADANGMTLDAVGILPIADQWSLTGRAGVARTWTESYGFSNSSGNGLKVGFGTEYAISPTLAMRGELERYQLDIDGFRHYVDQYSVGLKLRF